MRIVVFISITLLAWGCFSNECNEVCLLNRQLAAIEDDAIFSCSQQLYGVIKFSSDTIKQEINASSIPQLKYKYSIIDHEETMKSILRISVKNLNAESFITVVCDFPKEISYTKEFIQKTFKFNLRDGVELVEVYDMY